ncbi:MAG: hypothetical protein KF847_12280 [Pirellulales bacterium]|nr:hypothetical protein [Pirellulales bacterium]
MTFPRRYSLRLLLTALTIAAVACGGAARSLQLKQAERAALLHFQQASVGAGPLAGPSTPAWLVPLLGQDHFQHLRSLQLWGVGPATLTAAGDVRWAETVHFMESSRSDRAPLLPLETFAAFAKLSRVRDFMFTGPYDDRVLEYVKNWPLERCCLIDTRIRGGGLAALRPERLKVLTLVNSPVDDAGLLALGRFVDLRGLLLDNVPVEGTELGRLNSLDSLEMLCLFRLPLRQGVLQELRLKNLKTLAVARTRLSDQDCLALANCSQLRELYLVDSRVSDQTINLLAQRLPKCRFHLQEGYAVARELPRPAPHFQFDTIFLLHPGIRDVRDLTDIRRTAFPAASSEAAPPLSFLDPPDGLAP